MEIGWIAAIIVGGIAGWLAEQFMKSQMGLLMNIILGIVGAAIASWLFGLVGVKFGPGWIGYLIAGFIGAVILIFVGRLIRQRAYSRSSTNPFKQCATKDMLPVALPAMRQT